MKKILLIGGGVVALAFLIFKPKKAAAGSPLVGSAPSVLPDLAKEYGVREGFLSAVWRYFSPLAPGNFGYLAFLDGRGLTNSDQSRTAYDDSFKTAQGQQRNLASYLAWALRVSKTKNVNDPEVEALAIYRHGPGNVQNKITFDKKPLTEQMKKDFAREVGV